MAGIDNNTIVYLNGDNFEDSSLNKYPILNEGITINNDGKFGSCFDFTKNSCSMIVNSDIRLPLDVFTIDWWEKDTGGSTTGSRSFINNLPNSSDSSMRSFHIGKEDNSNIVKIWLSSSKSSWDIAQSVSIGNTHLNEWVHRAVINDGTNVKCYENGKLFISIPLNGKKIYPSDNKIRFGLMRNGTVSYGANVDEIRISNTVIWEGEFIPPTNQYSRDIELKISEDTLNIKVINKNMEKIEILINDIVCNVYTNILDNFSYKIDKSKCSIGDNIIIVRCFYSSEYVENYKLTHTVNVNMLPISSSLKDVIDMQSLLNNSIENQRLKLKNILASKDVECSDTDKMSSLIDKVEEIEKGLVVEAGDDVTLQYIQTVATHGNGSTWMEYHGFFSYFKGSIRVETNFTNVGSFGAVYWQLIQKNINGNVVYSSNTYSSSDVNVKHDLNVSLGDEICYKLSAFSTSQKPKIYNVYVRCREVNFNVKNSI